MLYSKMGTFRFQHVKNLNFKVIFIKITYLKGFPESGSYDSNTDRDRIGRSPHTVLPLGYFLLSSRHS